MKLALTVKEVDELYKVLDNGKHCDRSLNHPLRTLFEKVDVLIRHSTDEDFIFITNED